MQGKQLDVETILNSKVYMSDKSMVNFGSPRQYIEPFLEKFVQAGVTPVYTVHTAERVANRESTSEVVNEAYGRVVIQAKLPDEFTALGHNSTIGLTYALDTVKPMIRIYSGEEAWACTNLAIFGAKYIHEVPIMSGVSSIYEKSLEYVEGVVEQLAKFQRVYERMHDKLYTNEEIDRVVGHILRESNKNKSIGTTPILAAIKDLDDPKSKYSIKDGATDQWNIYSALTQYITDKVDIFERAVKTQLVSNLFVQDI